MRFDSFINIKELNTSDSITDCVKKYDFYGNISSLFLVSFINMLRFSIQDRFIWACVFFFVCFFSSSWTFLTGQQKKRFNFGDKISVSSEFSSSDETSSLVPSAWLTDRLTDEKKLPERLKFTFWLTENKTLSSGQERSQGFKDVVSSLKGLSQLLIREPVQQALIKGVWRSSPVTRGDTSDPQEQEGVLTERRPAGR